MQGFPDFKNLVDMASTRSIQNTDRELMAFLNEAGEREGVLTFEGLDQAARHIAAGLVEKGLSKTNVILLYAPGLDYISAFFGCLYAGATPVPAYPPMGARDIERLKRVVMDCGAKAILTSSMLLPMIESWVANPSNGISIPCVATDILKSQSDTRGFTPYDAAPNDIAFLQYTSGSTGHPKGVMVSHANLLANFQQILWTFAATTDEKVLETFKTVIWLPPFHDMGLIGGVLTPVFVAAPVTLMSPLTFLKNPFVWLKAISDERAKVTGGPNFSYQYCARKIKDEQLEQLDLSSLEIAFNGAEAIHMDSLNAFDQRFASCGFKKNAFLPCYGLAEATLYVSGSPKDRGARVLTADLKQLANGKVTPSDFPETEFKDKNETVDLVSSGVLAINSDVRIVDPKKLTLCNEGEVGEVWVSSPSVARGYWNKPSFSSSVFDAEINNPECSGKTYLRTGDLGFIWDKELYITGRMKEIIIVAGRNHYPQDIEWALQSSNSLIRKGCGAAFSVTEQGEEHLIVMQEVSPEVANQANGEVGYRDLAIQGSRAIASRHGITPKAIVFIAPGTLPKTSSGKIQRAEAKKIYSAGNLVPVYTWEPVVAKSESKSSDVSDTKSDLAEQAYTDWHSQMYQEMQQWVSDKLSIEAHHIDLDVPFSELGVDSIEAVELIDRLQDSIQRTIPATELMRYPTVKALIDHLATEVSDKLNQEFRESVTEPTN